MRPSAALFMKSFPVTSTVLAAAVALWAALALGGCERRPDRLVTAEGRVLYGDLESIDGGAVTISGAGMILEHDEARIFLRDAGTDCRGYVRFSGGTFTVGSGAGAVDIPKGEVGSIIWSRSDSEIRLTLEVPAAAGWVGTGIEVSPGDRLVLAAGGRVSMETGTCGPSGIDYFSTAMALVPGATNGQLVMSVGEATPVAAGSSWTGDAPGSGELRLAVNRPNRESVAGVGGSYTVTVIRTPGVLGRSVLYLSPD